MEFNEALEVLDEDTKARLIKCTTKEDFVELAHEKGMDLTDEQLEALSGGIDWHCTGHASC